MLNKHLIGNNPPITAEQIEYLNALKGTKALYTKITVPVQDAEETISPTKTAKNVILSE